MKVLGFIVRRFVLVFLMCLALTGIAITGMAPPPVKRKENDRQSAPIELLILVDDKNKADNNDAFYP